MNIPRPMKIEALCSTMILGTATFPRAYRRVRSSWVVRQITYERFESGNEPGITTSDMPIVHLSDFVLAQGSIVIDQIEIQIVEFRVACKRCRAGLRKIPRHEAAVWKCDHPLKIKSKSY